MNTVDVQTNQSFFVRCRECAKYALKRMIGKVIFFMTFKRFVMACAEWAMLAGQKSSFLRGSFTDHFPIKLSDKSEHILKDYGMEVSFH